ncbi:hypothetical protein STENM36S_03286 [Streptomyces tendae]
MARHRGRGQPEAAHPLQLGGAVVGLVEGGAVGDRAVVAEQAAGAVPEGLQHAAGEFVGAVGRVGGDPDGAAEGGRHVVHRREFGDEQGDRRRVHGVGVDDGPGVGVRAVHGQVHGQFAGGDQRAEHLPSVQVDAGRVARGQPVVGHARRGDQDRVADAHGDVAGGADDQPVRHRPAGRRDEFLPGRLPGRLSGRFSGPSPRSRHSHVSSRAPARPSRPLAERPCGDPARDVSGEHRSGHAEGGSGPASRSPRRPAQLTCPVHPGYLRSSRQRPRTIAWVNGKLLADPRDCGGNRTRV